MKRTLVLWAAALLLARAADAQQRLTLADALRLGAERSPDLLTARNDLAAARAQRNLARQLPNPTAGWSTTKIPTDGTPASTELGNTLWDRSYDTTIAITQLVEIAGKRGARRRSADEGIEAARARLADTERQLRASIVHAYVALSAANATADLARETAESFGKTAALAAARESAGEISAAERAQIEIAAGRFAADASAADAASRIAAAALATALRLSPEDGPVTAADPPETLVAATAAIHPSLADDPATLAARPDILALEAGVRRAEADLALQKAQRIPDPTFLVQYEHEPMAARNTVGFGAAVPLPILSRNAGGIGVASAVLDGARIDLQRARLRLDQERTATRATLDAAVRREALIAGDILPKAERVKETVRFAWEQGAASLLELLEAERSANDIRVAATAARADLVNARADFATGRMLPILSTENPR